MLTPPISDLTTMTLSLAEQIAARDPDNPFFSFEFFPPRTDQVRASFYSSNFCLIPNRVLKI
jgi:hypothetical protein